MHLVTDPAANVPEATDEPAPSHPPRSPAKVTARMLQIRELIDLGEYPDLDQLAERIVDGSKAT